MKYTDKELRTIEEMIFSNDNESIVLGLKLLDDEEIPDIYFETLKYKYSQTSASHLNNLIIIMPIGLWKRLFLSKKKI